MNSHKIFNFVMALIFAVSLSGTSVPVFAQEHSPTITAFPFYYTESHSNQVYGNDWTPGSTVTLSIDDPTNGAGWDYTDLQVVPFNSTACYAGNQYCFVIDPDIFKLQPGQIVRLTNGIVTKEHVVTSLRILGMNYQGDTVSGTAEAGSQISIWAQHQNGQAMSRIVIADQAGNWVANYAIPGSGDNEQIFDLQPNDLFIFTQSDQDGNSTRIWWELPNSNITVFPHYYTRGDNSNQVFGNDWTPGTTVTLFIDDPINGVGWDYTASQVVPSAPINPNCFAVNQLCFGIDPNIFQLQPGHIVHLSDGAVTKEHVVTNLRILGADYGEDTVGGTADAGSQITIWAQHQNGQMMRRIVATDEAGNWVANFTVPGNGDNELTFDLQLNDLIILSQPDEDGNSTKIWWRQPKPVILSQSDFDSILGIKWPAGNIVTLIVDDTPTPIPPYLYTGSQSVGSNFNAVFDVGSAIDLLPGQYVTLSDGITTKSMQIADVHFDSIDETTNTATGRGPHDIAQTWCYIPTINDGYCEITLGSDDHWIASFTGVLDLQNIQEASAHFIDMDGDTTVAFLASNQPQLTALSPAKVWVGLKNSDDVGTKFDLLAEVYQNNTLVGSGQLDKVNGGSSGFNNAKLNTIPLTLFAPIDWPQDSALNLKLYVRNTCFGNTHNSGTARLWYNDASADSQFGATIDNLSQDYFLKDGFTLSLTPGSGPRKTIDVAAGKPCSPYKLFGTWSIVP